MASRSIKESIIHTLLVMILGVCFSDVLERWPLSTQSNKIATNTRVLENQEKVILDNGCKQNADKTLNHEEGTTVECQDNSTDSIEEASVLSLQGTHESVCTKETIRRRVLILQSLLSEDTGQHDEINEPSASLFSIQKKVTSVQIPRYLMRQLNKFLHL